MQYFVLLLEPCILVSQYIIFRELLGLMYSSLYNTCLHSVVSPYSGSTLHSSQAVKNPPFLLTNICQVQNTGAGVIMLLAHTGDYSNTTVL